MKNNIKEIWSELKSEALTDKTNQYRRYNRLELPNEAGIRLGYVTPEGTLEILIQAGEAVIVGNYPRWRGMKFETIVLDIPMPDTKHIRLFLKDREHEDVFTIVCDDLIQYLKTCRTEKQRRAEFDLFLKRWSRFFERCGQDGLSLNQQMGLFGELWWLAKMLENGVGYNKAVSSWRGCEHGYHDFEFDGRILEVKTTRTKEHRRVKINNERQLDDQGLSSLHLFILTLHSINGDTGSLPELVQHIREILGNNSVRDIFERLLIKAGYLNIHIPLYVTKYIAKQQELFHVQNGFPRIISIPDGTGDLQYSVTVSACKNFETKIQVYINQLLEV